MLSVINRGTLTGSDTDGLPYKVVDGYVPGLEIIKLIGIPEPLEIEVDPTILNGYLGTTPPIILENISLANVPINPVIKNGYTPITINPEEG